MDSRLVREVQTFSCKMLSISAMKWESICRLHINIALTAFTVPQKGIAGGVQKGQLTLTALHPNLFLIEHNFTVVHREVSLANVFTASKYISSVKISV